MSSSPSSPVEGLFADSGRDLTGPVVTILVGPAEKSVFIHRTLLTSKSAFFNAALAGPWAESTTGIIRLSDEDPELFSLYASWIYNHEWAKDADGKEATFHTCCHLFVLADKLGSEALQNAAIDKLREYGMRPHLELSVETISFVYGATLPGSVLRKLVTDILAWEMDPISFRGLITAAPECLYDAFRVCTNRLPIDSKVPLPYQDDQACKNYHIHYEGSFCSLPSNLGTGEDQSQV